MHQIANPYSTANFAKGNWFAPMQPFTALLANANQVTANASGAIANFAITIPQAGIRTSYAPDPAYAALYAQQSAYPEVESYPYDDGAASFAIFNSSWAANHAPLWGANQPPGWGANQPPLWGMHEPIGDLYHWGKESPKDDTPTRRRRREKPDEPDRPEPSKPRQDITGKIIGDPIFYGAEGEKYKIAGEPGKIYNLMSDRNVQVNGKVETLPNSYIGYREMGFVVNGGTEIKVSFDQRDKMTVKVKENGQERTLTAAETTDDFTWSPSAPGRNWPKLTVKAAGGQDGERWEFDVTYKATRSGSTNGEKSRFLNLGIRGYDIISDEQTTTGLWGHSLDGRKNDVAYNDGVGAGGVLRDSTGAIVGKNASRQAYDAALKNYEMASLTSTSGGFSAYR